MSSKPSMDFFDIPSKKPDKAITQEETSYFDIPSAKNSWIKPPAPSASEQLQHLPELVSREIGSSLWSLPSMTAESWRSMGNLLKERGEEQAASQGREVSDDEKKFTENVINFLPDLWKKFGEKFPKLAPTHEEASEVFNKQYLKETGKELPKEGRGAIEKFGIGAGRAAPLLVSGGSGAVNLAAAITSGATEAMDLSEKNKLIGNLTIPTLLAVVESIAKRRYIPPKGEATELYKKGKELGMTEKQLAPILATEGQVQRHGTLASGISKTRKSFEQTGEVLGNVLEDMQNRPKNLKPLPSKVHDVLVSDLEDMRLNIRNRTAALSSEEKSAIQFLDDAIHDISTNEVTNKKLIGTWRSINKSGANKRDIQAMKEPILKAIKDSDPALAQDLIGTNKLYSKYLSNLKEINPAQFNAYFEAGELQQLLGAVFTGKPLTLGKQALNMATAGTLRRISSAILTDPNAQSLVRNFGKAVRDGRKTSSKALGNQLKEYVRKNLPEEYKEVNWEELDL